MDFGNILIFFLIIVMISIVIWLLLNAPKYIPTFIRGFARGYSESSTSDPSSAASRSDHSTSNIRTHYDNLQVTENASIEVIRGAYKYLAQKWHPDKHPNDKERVVRIMKIIGEAYSVLSDPEKRKEHDAWIRSQREQIENDEAPQSEDTSEPIIFLAKIGSGYFGLAKTFWVYGFMVRVVANFILNTITTGFVIFLLVYSVYETLVLMGIWNASDNYKGSAVWAVLAKVTVVLGAIMLAILLFIAFGLITDAIQ